MRVLMSGGGECVCLRLFVCVDVGAQTRVEVCVCKTMMREFS